MQTKGFFYRQDSEASRPSPSISGVVGGLITGLILAVFLGVGYHFAGEARFCGVCHSMKSEYSAWGLSKHKQFACVECHLPAGTMVEKVIYKARAGLRDIYHETLRDYPASILLSQEGKLITSGNCLRCHFSTVEQTPMVRNGQNCIKCHRYLVHGTGSGKEL